MTRTIYLAGPILGCTDGEANDWRHKVAEALKPHGIVGISPLRCEPLHGERYGAGYDDERFGTPRAIASKNLFDVLNCDMTFAYLPTPPAGRDQSWGTICEIAWAYAYRRPAIIVSDDDKIHRHPVVQACGAWMLKTLQEGVDVAVGILGGYSGGKNV